MATDPSRRGCAKQYYGQILQAQEHGQIQSMVRFPKQNEERVLQEKCRNVFQGPPRLLTHRGEAARNTTESTRDLYAVFTQYLAQYLAPSNYVPRVVQARFPTPHGLRVLEPKRQANALNNQRAFNSDMASQCRADIQAGSTTLRRVKFSHETNHDSIWHFDMFKPVN